MTAAPWNDPEVLARLTVADEAEPAANLPEQFWSARPLFRHVRQAAWSRTISADAVLGVMLVRAAFHLDHRIVLPAIVGRFSPLNLFAGIAGPSGTGKGSANDAGLELLGVPRNAIGYRTIELPAVSGEGLIRGFCESVAKEEGKGSELRQVYDGAFIRVDEGELLAKLGKERSGSTLWQVLRMAWSGEALGFGNASADRRVPRIPPLSYRLCVVLGIQPNIAREILADVDGGTPQRFLWCNTIDPAVPLTPPRWPGPIEWDAPQWGDGRQALDLVFGTKRRVLEVASSITAELREAQHAKVAGHGDGGMDSHAGLNRLKIGAVLAALDGRLCVNDDDWELAGMVLATSDAVRAGMAASIRASEQQAEDGRNFRSAVRAGIEEVSRLGSANAVERVAGVVGRYVHRNHGGGEFATKKQVRYAVAGQDRTYVNAAIELAIRQRFIVDDGLGRFGPGSVQPEGV
jgi:hypothetical protein